MRNIKITLFVLSVTIFCSCSNQPTCGGGDVKEALFDLIKGSIKRRLKEDYYEENSADLRMYRHLYKSLDYEKAKKAIESKADAYAQIEAKKVTFELNRVRLLKRVEETKSCGCAAELIIKDKNTYDIQYFAQYTEDGQVYVEVLDLDFYNILKYLHR